MDKEELKSQDASGPDDLDWDNRILCRDGNCIGVIGANGRCNECDLIYDASQQSDDNSEPDDIAAIETDDVVAAIETDNADYDDTAEDEKDEFGSVDDEDMINPDSDWENRQLCSDGNCIGVIGADGCCRECGKEQDSVDNLSGAA